MADGLKQNPEDHLRLKFESPLASLGCRPMLDHPSLQHLPLKSWRTRTKAFCPRARVSQCPRVLRHGGTMSMRTPRFANSQIHVIVTRPFAASPHHPTRLEACTSQPFHVDHMTALALEQSVHHAAAIVTRGYRHKEAQQINRCQAS